MRWKDLTWSDNDGFGNIASIIDVVYAVGVADVVHVVNVDVVAIGGY